MPSSYESINYALRPAKNIERRMFCEVFRRLVEFGKLESYRYVGFGSPFFCDFSLFHKSLRISNNVSIEHDIENQRRFEFNRPYSCIKIIFGESNDILPTLEWKAKTIAWLDYDYELDNGVLTDVAFVCANASSGSVLIVTVDARPGDYGKRLELLESRIEEYKLPHKLSEAEVAGWGTANVYWRIISNEINDTLAARNGSRSHGNKLVYRQLFNFHYADGAKMLTMGGILYNERHYELVEKCNFESFDFVTKGENAYKIEVPSLTLKEIRHLDKQLPCKKVSHIESPSIPPADIERYARIYRYFPAFVEAEIG